MGNPPFPHPLPEIGAPLSLTPDYEFPHCSRLIRVHPVFKLPPAPTHISYLCSTYALDREFLKGGKKKGKKEIRR